MHLGQLWKQRAEIPTGSVILWFLISSMYQAHQSDGTLTLYQDTKKWTEAKQACQTIGSRLAIDPSDTDILSHASSGEYWIGLVKINNHHKYWIDGTQYRGSRISGPGKCINARFSGDEIQWRGSSCNGRKMYYCEDVKPPVETYTYISQTVTSYDDANRLCQDRGCLHLAIMDTNERQHLFSIAMDIEYDARPVWIGLRRRSGDWTWADGSALTSDYWRNGHPEQGRNCARARPSTNFLDWWGEPCDNTNRRVVCFNLGSTCSSPVAGQSTTAGSLTRSTISPPPAMGPVASQVISTESSTMSTITTASATTSGDPDNLHTIPSEPSFQQLTCTIASVTTSLGTCPLPQPNTETNSAMAHKVTSTLLDNNHATCMRPFQFDSQIQMSFDTEDTRGSSLFHIKVTGEGIHCSQPSTVVHLDLAEAPSSTKIISKLECPVVESSHNAHLVTCTYMCRPLASCQGSARFGVQVKRISWLAQSQRLEQLCDIRAFVWI